jgi:hypothetical protein
MIAEGWPLGETPRSGAIFTMFRLIKRRCEVARKN